MTVINLIVAMDKAGVIGVDGTLPWRIPEDLRRFKTITDGGIVVAGRKTWESLPVKPLPNRHNVVISRGLQWGNPEELPHEISDSLETWLAKYIQSEDPRPAYIIGGRSMYDAALGFIAKTGVFSQLHLTVVKPYAERTNNTTFFSAYNDIDLSVSGPPELLKIHTALGYFYFHLKGSTEYVDHTYCHYEFLI